jgi:hypothetical protein
VTTLKGFDPQRTLSGFESLLYSYSPGFSLRSNPGLQLANAFGVIKLYHLRLKKLDVLRCQIGISKFEPVTVCDRFREASGSSFSAYAFTEQGVAMLSSVLRSKRAITVNIEIMRAFVKLRQLLASNAELSRQLAELERKYHKQFRVVFDAIRQLMATPVRNRKEIGFRSRSVKK